VAASRRTPGRAGDHGWEVPRIDAPRASTLGPHPVAADVDEPIEESGSLTDAWPDDGWAWDADALHGAPMSWSDEVDDDATTPDVELVDDGDGWLEPAPLRSRGERSRAVARERRERRRVRALCTVGGVVVVAAIALVALRGHDKSSGAAEHSRDGTATTVVTAPPTTVPPTSTTLPVTTTTVARAVTPGTTRVSPTTPPTSPQNPLDPILSLIP